MAPFDRSHTSYYAVHTTQYLLYYLNQTTVLTRKSAVRDTAGVPPGITTFWTRVNRTILWDRETHKNTDPQRDALQNSTV